MTGCGPSGLWCEGCGLRGTDLVVVTVDLPPGVACLTLCQLCRTATTRLAITDATAHHLVAEHARHQKAT